MGSDRTSWGAELFHYPHTPICMAIATMLTSANGLVKLVNASASADENNIELPTAG